MQRVAHLFTMLSSRSSPGATCICSRDVAGGAVLLAGVDDLDDKAGVLALEGGPGAIGADLCRVVLVDGDGVLAAAAVPAACALSHSSCGAPTSGSQTCNAAICLRCSPDHAGH